MVSGWWNLIQTINSLRPSDHTCVGNLTIIGSDNGLSPGRRQAVILTNAGVLSIGPLGTKFSEILIEILRFSFKKICLKVSSAKWRPFCLGLNVLIAAKNYLNVITVFSGGLAVLTNWGWVQWRYCSVALSHGYISNGDTVETLYNTVNFCWSTHKRHSIARPKGRGMGCLLWVQRATYCVDLSQLSSIKYLL